MGKFREYLSELRRVGLKRLNPNQLYYIISFRGWVWVLTEKNFPKFKNDIIKKIGMQRLGKFGVGSLNKLIQEIQESHPDVITGTVYQNELSMSNIDWRHSTASPDLKKLIDNLKLMGVRIEGDPESVDLRPREFSQDLSKLPFFHGTSFNAFKGRGSVFSIGITPRTEGNYGKITHEDKVFVTLNQEKALYHSYNAAQKQKSFPIVIELKIPDVNRLVPDYDLSLDMYGIEHPDTINTGYTDIAYRTGKQRAMFPDVVKRQKEQKTNLEKKLGVFGYMGRIPANFITYVHVSNAFNQFYLATQIYGETFDVFESTDDIGTFDTWNTYSLSEFKQLMNDIEEESIPPDEENG